MAANVGPAAREGSVISFPGGIKNHCGGTGGMVCRREVVGTWSICDWCVVGNIVGTNVVGQYGLCGWCAAGCAVSMWSICGR